jgi:hypothetical protein
MHCHFERQHLAARGVARVRTALSVLRSYAMPTQASWSFAVVTTNAIDAKPRPRPLVTSP